MGALLIALSGCTGGDSGNGGDTEATPEAAAGSATAVAADVGIPGPVEAAAASGVTVTGAGVASGAPDVAHVTVGVQVQRETVDEALEVANSTTQDVLATLDELGIAEEDRQTRDFGIHPVMEPTPEGEAETTGYQVRNLVEVTVRDVDRLGEVIQQAAQAAGEQARVEGVTFGLEDDDELLAAAREAAMADAQEQAEHYAELAGRELGALIGIQDQSGSAPRPAMGRSFAEDAAAEAAVPVAPGEQEVVVQVVARWALD